MPVFSRWCYTQYLKCILYCDYFPFCFVPLHINGFSFLSLATRQECVHRYLAGSIVMYPRCSTRRVLDVRHVSVCHRFISLQTTSHLLLQFSLLLYGYFNVCFVVDAPELTRKHPGTCFSSLPNCDPIRRLCLRKR